MVGDVSAFKILFVNFVRNFVSSNFCYVVLYSVGEWWSSTRAMSAVLPLEESITNWHKTTEKRERKLWLKMN